MAVHRRILAYSKRRDGTWEETTSWNSCARRGDLLLWADRNPQTTATSTTPTWN